MELNGMDEFKMKAYANAKLYKERTNLRHDKHILAQNFELGHHILLYNSRLMLFSYKLKSRWSSPFIVIQAFPHGVVEIRDERTGTQFMINGQRFKKFFGGDWIGYVFIIALEDK